MQNFSKKCPTCGKDILYKSSKSFKNSLIKNSDCRSCGGLKLNKKGKLSRSIPNIRDVFDYWTVIDNTLYEIKKGQSNITASLDRIDSSKGYVEGNVQWVHKDVNYIKQDLEESYFKKLCKLITENE